MPGENQLIPIRFFCEFLCVIQRTVQKTVKVRLSKPKSQVPKDKILHYEATFSLTQTQSIYRQCPEKIRCSQSETGLSDSVRETNMQPLQLSVCCLGLGVRIDAAELLFSSLVPLVSVQGQHPETHTELKVIHLQFCSCTTVAGLRWVVHAVFR